MTHLLTYRTEQDDLEVQYEIILPFDHAVDINPFQSEIAQKLESVDSQLEICEKKVAELNAEIDRLTNHADGLDYAVAVASGILTGLIDSFFVGELGLFENASDEAKESFNEAKGKSNELVNKFIEKYAKLKGYNPEGKKDSLKSAIEFLEKKYPVAQDNTWSGEGISSSHTHHLDDLAHHPTLFGLLSAIIVQFFRISLFASKDGKLHFEAVETNLKDLSCWVPVVITGVLKWLTYLAKEHDKLCFDDDVPEPIRKLVNNIHKVPAIIQVLSVADNWFGHLVSDMGGSKQTPGGGTGIPGIFISFLKEISMLPILKDTSLPQIVNDLYTNKNKYITHKIDLRTEIAVVKKQAMPVILNEVIVRTFYFVRRLITEYQEHHSIVEMDWRKIVPLGNRTVERMMTIATGTFTAVDLADAAIRSGGISPACLLRVNFVGVGRFAIAIVTDISMGIKRGKLQKEKYVLLGQQLDLLNAKVSYLYASAEYEFSDALNEQNKLWITAGDTVSTLMEASNSIDEAITFYKESICEIYESMQRAVDFIDAVENKNPGLTHNLSEKIKWGE